MVCERSGTPATTRRVEQIKSRFTSLRLTEGIAPGGKNIESSPNTTPAIPHPRTTTRTMLIYPNCCTSDWNLPNPFLPINSRFHAVFSRIPPPAAVIFYHSDVNRNLPPPPPDSRRPILAAEFPPPRLAPDICRGRKVRRNPRPILADKFPPLPPSFPRKRESIFTDKSPHSRRFFVEKRGEFAVLFLKMDSRFRGNDGGFLRNYRRRPIPFPPVFLRIRAGLCYTFANTKEESINEKRNPKNHHRRRLFCGGIV